MGRRGLIATLVVGCCAVMPASAAQAQSEPGVTIDQGSPSAKEYGIPLEDARRKADPSGSESGRVVQGSRKSPLFGEGVSSAARQKAGGSSERGSGAASSAGGGRSSRGSSAGGARGEKRGRPSAADRTSAGAAASRRSPAPVVEAAAQPGAPSGGSSTALFVGIGAVVLALGAIGGLLLRRRTGP
jgi:hypothetical protein